MGHDHELTFKGQLTLPDKATYSCQIFNGSRISLSKSSQLIHTGWVETEISLHPEDRLIDPVYETAPYAAAAPPWAKDED